MDSGGRRRRVALLRLLFLAPLAIVAAEIGARAFFRIHYGVPFFDPSRVLYAFYPDLQQVDADSPEHGDEFYDVLFLGESVLHKDWGAVEHALREELAYRGHRNVRVYNLAKPAHTSRDSWLKYAALGRARFDLVVVYDGINETRANNVPPELFREDYGHYSWYEVVNALAPYHGTARFALPYAARYLAAVARSALAQDRYIPTHAPREDWMRYGADPRSAVSLRHNLENILALAAERGDPVLLMTFAAYVPADYSLDAFKDKRLDYGLHLNAIEIWGQREHVLSTLALHNEIIRTLAAQHAGVIFVDQARLMSGSARYFNDVCHLTVLGSAKFAEHVADALPQSSTAAGRDG